MKEPLSAETASFCSLSLSTTILFRLTTSSPTIVIVRQGSCQSWQCRYSAVSGRVLIRDRALHPEASGPVTPDAVGEEGARAQVARDQLLDVRVPDFVQGVVVGGAALVFCRKKGKSLVIILQVDLEIPLLY